jgi:hypothetical protein
MLCILLFFIGICSKTSVFEQLYYGYTHCGGQFISDHEMTYRGCHSEIVDLVKIMLVRGMGIGDSSTILRIRITTVLKVLKSTPYKIQPKQKQYNYLEIDEFLTYVWGGMRKKNKIGLIYVSSGARRNRGVCMETGHKDGESIEETDKSAGDKL